MGLQDEPNVLHIKIDSDHVRPDGAFGFAMLEQIVQNDYPDAIMETKRNAHGLLTDIWIKFLNQEDLLYFRLKWHSK